jgi:hypothetical protein
MRSKGRTVIDLILYALIVVLALCIVLPVLASGPPEENLLENPGFEGRFEQYGPFKTAIVAEGWTPWWRPQPAGSPAWKMRMPEYKAAAPYENRLHSGWNAQQLFTAYGTHIGGIYQVVDGIEPGSTVHFTIWGHAWAGGDDDPYRSKDGGPMHVAIGIDPTGGTSAFSPRVTWSEERNPLDTWTYFEGETVATVSRMTVFTRSAPEYPTKHNDVYWDDAELIVTAPAPTPTGTPRVFFSPVDTPTATDVAGNKSQRNKDDGDPRHAVTPTQTSSPTSPPTSEPTRAAPSPTPTKTPTLVIPATSSVCITAYEDRNTNRSRDKGESVLAGVTFVLRQSLGDTRQGAASWGAVEGGEAREYLMNDTDESLCFESLDPGTYYLTATPPPGYRPASNDAWEIRLGSKDADIRVGFRQVRRMQPAFPTHETPRSAEEMPPSLFAPWMVFLLAGGTLAATGFSVLQNIR